MAPGLLLGALVVLVLASGVSTATTPHASPAISAMRPTVALPAFGTYDYSNTTYHLPNYDPMIGLVNSDPGFQYPTLSSSAQQPFGIYYVQNETGGTYPFVELSLATDTVHEIADVIPLNQSYAGYKAMLDNEFYLEYGYDVALFFGTNVSHGGTYSIELVNLTTGQLSIWNTSAPIAPTNQQPEYLGEGIVAVMSANGSIVGYNLPSHVAWNMYPTRLPYFEANNAYWLPQMDQLINVEAGGSTHDQLEVLALGTGVDPTFHLAQTFNWSTSDYAANGVDGIGFNSNYSTSTPAIFLTIGEGAADAHDQVTTVIPYASTGDSSSNLLTAHGQVTTVGGCGPGLTDGFMGQRYAYTSSYIFCQARNAVDDPYLWDPWNDTLLATNISPEDIHCFNQCFEGTYAPSSAWLLNFNASAVLAGGRGNSTAPPYNVVFDNHTGSGPTPALQPPTLVSALRSSPTRVALAFEAPEGGPLPYRWTASYAWFNGSCPTPGAAWSPVYLGYLEVPRLARPVGLLRASIPVPAPAPQRFCFDVSYTSGGGVSPVSNIQVSSGLVLPLAGPVGPGAPPTRAPAPTSTGFGPPAPPLRGRPVD